MITIKDFFDPDTFTMTYCVWDSNSLDAVLIDPVLNYEPQASKITTKSVEEVLKFVQEKKLKLHLLLETHVHADHLTGSDEIKKRFPELLIVINENISKVQSTFSKIYNLNIATDGSQFGLLNYDGQTLAAGNLRIQVLSTPGHTPACVSYLIGNAVFTGDALFLPKDGVGRCDFPAGDANQLYDSVTKKLYGLSDKVRVFPGHDYQEGEHLRSSTILEEKQSNIHLKAETSKSDFVKFRTDRDKTLKAPRLLLPSIQINMDAGRLPAAESNGTRYLKIPLF